MTKPDLNGALSVIEEALAGVKTDIMEHDAKDLESKTLGRGALGEGLTLDTRVKCEQALTLLRAIKEAVDVEKLREALIIPYNILVAWERFNDKYDCDPLDVRKEAAQLLREIAGGGDG